MAAVLDLHASLSLAGADPGWSLPAPVGDPTGGVAALLIALTLIHLALRGLDRLGLITYRGLALRRGLAQAAVALNAIFQPHTQDPEQEERMTIQMREEDDTDGPGLDPPSEALDVEHFPDDQLR